MLLVVLLAAVVWVVVAVSWSRRPRHRDDAGTIVTLAVLGSGGHTSELLTVMKGMDRGRYRPLHYVVADTDRTSQGRVLDQDAVVHLLPRSRHVGQSFLSAVPTTLVAILAAIRLVLSVRPELVLCNGPGTCVPICIAAVASRLLGRSCHIVFIESFCRVRTLSLSGRIMYHVAASFYVQWPTLQARYPRAKYIGLLC
ncbi:UDP-N-acetylglucosamine transferase subunit ALG14 [Plasmodiophora brassicae]|uniref:UDP-N-acetylglucosamine transferase subunit ALG14 n=1 Tax=Plasmodiophora brassicae TaxID=37360 RepID=A0A0G4IVY0_PLABS|nr:hypothetical protein PBRA_007231 [Plasmodiophora brassicae]SPQ96002.1 unnamed protein product [Plasmodiophora brassicae]